MFFYLFPCTLAVTSVFDCYPLYLNNGSVTYIHSASGSTSALDYGSIVYGSPSKSLLKQMDPIHRQCLRIGLGAFRTSTVQSVCVQAPKPSLDISSIETITDGVIKLNYCPNNPAYSCFWTAGYLAIREVSIRHSFPRPPDVSAFGELYVKSRCNWWYLDLGHCP